MVGEGGRRGEGKLWQRGDSHAADFLYLTVQWAWEFHYSTYQPHHNVEIHSQAQVQTAVEFQFYPNRRQRDVPRHAVKAMCPPFVTE
jgi:hypothetical protein